MDMSIRFPNLQIYFGYVGRSVSIFGFEITIYGLLIAAGMLLGLIFVLRQAKAQNENQNLYLEMMIPAMLGGVIGARAFYVLFNWNLFSGRSAAEICDIRNGGMSLYGGILGGALLAALYCRIRKVSFQRMADTASMGLLITQIIGVWGNFFNRESFGGYTDSLFAMQIPADIVHPGQITETIEEHLVTVGDVSYIQVHPLFLYESLWCLLLFLVLLVYTRRKTYQGEVFLRYLAGLGLGGAGIEWLRTDALKIPGTDFPVFSAGMCAFVPYLRSIGNGAQGLMEKSVKQGGDAGERSGMRQKKKQPLIITICRVMKMWPENSGTRTTRRKIQKMPERLQTLRKIRKNFRKNAGEIPEAVKKTSLRMQKIRRNTISLQRKIKMAAETNEEVSGKWAEMPGRYGGPPAGYRRRHGGNRRRNSICTTGSREHGRS